MASTASGATIDNAALKQLAGKVDELPLLPQVLVKIMQLDKSADDYFEQFEALAKEDPPFAVRVLSLANSAASAPVEPITSIKESIIRMGASTIGSLVASLSVQRVFMPTKPDQIGLWAHSIYAAVATQRLAQLSPQLKVDPSQAYLVGLLHDIGRFVMLEYAEPQLQAVDESHWASPEDLVEADVEVFKFTHSELGYLACKKWGLPDEVGNVVRVHHDEVHLDVERDPDSAKVLCVQLADHICLALLQNPDLPELSESDRRERIENDCLITPDLRSAFSVDALLKNIEPMAAEGNEILTGLGFASA